MTPGEYDKLDERMRGVEVQLARLCAHIESETGNQIKMIDEMYHTLNQHIESSVGIRDMVRENANFRAGATKAIWVAYTAIIGLIGKMFLVK